jgi:hypothetical protein
MAAIPKMKRTPSRSRRFRDLDAAALQLRDVSGLGEVGVAPQGDPAEPGPAAQGGGPVQVAGGVLVRGPVAAAVEQVQRLGGVGQRHHQRVVAPDAVVGDVDTLLAPTVGRGDRPVGVDEGLVEGRRRLLFPDTQPGPVEGVHQPLDVGLGEAAAEVAGGGGVGDAHCPEGVEVDLVVAPDLEVLQAGAACQEVVGDVQDVVALVVGQVSLQEVEVLVDVVDQAGPLGKEVDRADATGCDGPGPIGESVVDVGGGHHRLGAFDAGLVLQASGDAALASGELSADTGVHSKTSWWRTTEGCEAPRLFAGTRGFSSPSASIGLGLRLVED